MNEVVSEACRMGIDIGGTFTDVAAVDADGVLRIGKVLTTPGDEARGVLGAVDIGGVPLSDVDVLAHGTTLVINALIERRGARTALVTTAGFGDIHEIGRGNRPEISNLFYRRDPVLIPRELRIEVDERTYSDGQVARTPSEEELAELASKLRDLGVEACAVAFLNGYANPANEELVAGYLAEQLPTVFVTRATAISRQWREYERITTAAANAYVGPAMGGYSGSLQKALVEREFSGDFVFLASNGGAMTAEAVAEQPVRVVESGPVGGAVGAMALTRRLGIHNAVTLDIGGTTAKSCVIEAGRFGMADVFWVGGPRRGLPLQVPTLDVLEVGAGGGSIISVGPNGTLRVGPRSAGARPGPACYGLGGEELTVTDVNVFCGRLSPAFFEGTIDIYPELAHEAVERMSEQLRISPERLALGVLEIAATAMGSAVSRQTLERGRVPSDFTLVAYGGGGPLHAPEIAQSIGIRKILVPPSPGVFSALGMLGVDMRHERRTVLSIDAADLEAARLRATLAELATEMTAGSDHPEGARFSYGVELRYRGQEHTLLIPSGQQGLEVPDDIGRRLIEEFEVAYRSRFGYVDPASAVEAIEVEVVAENPLPPIPAIQPRIDAVIAPVDRTQVLFRGDEAAVATRVVHRSTLAEGDQVHGPAIVYELGATTIVPPRAVARAVGEGCLLIDIDPEDEA